MDQRHFLGIRLVERRIVDDQHAACPIDERSDFLPEGGGIGFEAVQEAGEGIMGRGMGTARLDASGLGGTNARGSDEEIDVIGIVQRGLFIPLLYPLAVPPLNCVSPMILRADLQKRIEQLRERLQASVVVQEGEQPPEDSQALLTELERLFVQLAALIARINRTNLHAALPSETTVTEALAQRDVLKLRVMYSRARLRRRPIRKATAHRQRTGIAAATPSFF